MKREVKFRGISTNTGKWVFGYFGYDWDSKTNLKPCIQSSLTGMESSFTRTIIKPDTLCECTGLKDKNGKCIYEGDILKSWYSRDMSGKDIIWMTYEVEHETIEGTGTSGFKIEFLNNAEVIGNIYENPNLLK